MPSQAVPIQQRPYIEIDDTVLNEMARAIELAVAPEKIIVFGSYARNASSAASDVDLLVIEREPLGKGRSRMAELARIRAALRRFRIPKDVLVYSEADIAELQSLPGHIVHECLRDGRVLYERPRSS